MRQRRRRRRRRRDTATDTGTNHRTEITGTTTNPTEDRGRTWTSTSTMATPRRRSTRMIRTRRNHTTIVRDPRIIESRRGIITAGCSSHATRRGIIMVDTTLRTTGTTRTTTGAGYRREDITRSIIDIEPRGLIAGPRIRAIATYRIWMTIRKKVSIMTDRRTGTPTSQTSGASGGETREDARSSRETGGRG